MPAPRQTLPTEDSPSAVIARRILRNGGTSLNAPDTSKNAAEFLSVGDAVASVYDDSRTATDQAIVDTATVMLPEIEASYSLTVRSDLSNAERQKRLLSKVRAARAGTPQDLKTAMSPYGPVLGVYENTAAAVASTNPAGVYIFAVLVTVAEFNDPNALIQLRAIIEQMKPAMTKGSITTRVGFRCDDPASLLDRDVLL